LSTYCQQIFNIIVNIVFTKNIQWVLLRDVVLSVMVGRIVNV